MIVKRTLGIIVRVQGPNPYLARYQDGSIAGRGLYNDFSEAQAVIQASIPGRRLVWEEIVKVNEQDVTQQAWRATT